MRPLAPATLTAALARLPAGNERGFRFVGSDGRERYYPYQALRAEARRRAGRLVAEGFRKGDRLALVIPEGSEFVLSFLGAVVAGLVPVPIFPSASFKAVDGYLHTLRHIITCAGARGVLVMQRNRAVLEPLWTQVGELPALLSLETVFAHEERADPEPVLPESLPEDPCFLQFTSGSTALPKGVVVTHHNLVANATQFLGPAGLDRRPDDLGVSWLPLFHDMGLIGFILGTLVCDIPVVVLPTETFARNPRIWLETIHRVRGTITYAPNFAYALAAKRVRDRDLARLDLSCLRVAGCGAEPINPNTMRAFAGRLASAGFRSEALLPSYGMAEATLAISFHERGAQLRVDRVRAEALRDGVAEPVAAEAPGTELVSCGRPFPGHELNIVDEGGLPVAERRVGEIVTRGPSVSPGYHRDPEATARAFRDGWLYTGDLGYIADGELYVCGRLKDLIIIRGANFHPQDIEWSISSLPGVRRDNVVAFGVLSEGEENLVVAVECASSDAPQLRKCVPARVSETTGLKLGYLATLRLGSLPKTSSGKIQRRKTKELFEERRLAEHPL